MVWLLRGGRRVRHGAPGTARAGSTTSNESHSGLFAGGGEILRLARPASRVLRLQDAKTFWPCSRS